MGKKGILLGFFLWAFTAFSGVGAQKILAPDATVSVLTSSPWREEVYALFGHTALRVHDETQGIDLVFSYGVFDFNQPHFIWHFVKGETNYQLGATTYANYAIEYQMNNLEVIEQALRLTPDEKNRLWEKLLVNYQPENREYRYNFFFDNCSTRPFRLIESCMEEKIELTALDTAVTFRHLIDQCTGNFPWLTYGIALVVAQPADETVDKYQILFLPHYLMRALQTAQVVAAGGNSYPLVERQSTIVAAESDNEADPNSFFEALSLPPLPVATLLLLAIVLLFFTGKCRRRTFAVAQGVLFGTAGLAGSLVFFLCFFSEHPAMFPNWNLLWLHPLQWVVPIAVIVKSHNKLLYCYHFINFALLLGFLSAAPFVSQAIPLTSAFFASVLVLCSARYIYCFKRS